MIHLATIFVLLAAASAAADLPATWDVHPLVSTNAAPLDDVTTARLATTPLRPTAAGAAVYLFDAQTQRVAATNAARVQLLPPHSLSRDDAACAALGFRSDVLVSEPVYGRAVAWRTEYGVADEHPPVRVGSHAAAAAGSVERVEWTDGAGLWADIRLSDEGMAQLAAVGAECRPSPEFWGVTATNVWGDRFFVPLRLRGIALVVDPALPLETKIHKGHTK